MTTGKKKGKKKSRVSVKVTTEKKDVDHGVGETVAGVGVGVTDTDTVTVTVTNVVVGVAVNEDARPLSMMRTAAQKVSEDEFMAASVGDVNWLKQSIKGKTTGSTHFDKNGLLSVHVAAMHGRLDCLRLLIETFGVVVDAVSWQGWTPLQLCVRNDNGTRAALCLEYLLEKGAQPSIPNHDGVTAMHQAAAAGHVQCLQALLAAHADVTCRDSRGQTPGQLARLWGHRRCARILASEQWLREKEAMAEYRQELNQRLTAAAAAAAKAVAVGPRWRLLDSPSCSSFFRDGEPPEATRHRRPEASQPPRGSSLHSEGHAPTDANLAYRGKAASGRRVEGRVGGGAHAEPGAHDGAHYGAHYGAFRHATAPQPQHTMAPQPQHTAAPQSQHTMTQHEKTFDAGLRVPEKPYVANLPDVERDEYTMLPIYVPRDASEHAHHDRGPHHAGSHHDHSSPGALRRPDSSSLFQLSMASTHDSAPREWWRRHVHRQSSSVTTSESDGGGGQGTRRRRRRRGSRGEVLPREWDDSPGWRARELSEYPSASIVVTPAHAHRRVVYKACHIDDVHTRRHYDPNEVAPSEIVSHLGVPLDSALMAPFLRAVPRCMRGGTIDDELADRSTTTIRSDA